MIFSSLSCSCSSLHLLLTSFCVGMQIALWRLSLCRRPSCHPPPRQRQRSSVRNSLQAMARLLIVHVVRTLLDFFHSIPKSKDVQMRVLQDNIDWAKKEKRIFLKQSLETRLVGLYGVCHSLTFWI